MLPLRKTFTITEAFDEIEKQECSNKNIGLERFEDSLGVINKCLCFLITFEAK